MNIINNMGEDKILVIKDIPQYDLKKGNVLYRHDASSYIFKEENIDEDISDNGQYFKKENKRILLDNKTIDQLLDQGFLEREGCILENKLSDIKEHIISALNIESKLNILETKVIDLKKEIEILRNEI